MSAPSVLGFNANEKSTVLSAMTVPVRPVVAERLRPGVSAVFGGNWTKAPRAEMMETRRMPAVAAAGVRLNDTIIFSTASRRGGAPPARRAGEAEQRGE